MNFKDFYIKYKLIVWSVVTGISELILLFLVIIPQLMSYLNIRNQIFEIQNRSYTLEAKAAELQKIDPQLTQKDLEVAFTILPADQDVPTSMAILQDLLAKSGLKLENTSFASRSQKKDSYQLKISVSGQINALRNFLIRLAEAPRIYQIEALSVQFQKSREEIGAEIPILVFYQPTPSTIGSLDQPVSKLSGDEQRLLAKLSTQIPVASTSANSQAASSNVPMGKANPFE